MKRSIVLAIGIGTLMLANAPARASVTWKGIDWTIYGADTTAVVNSHGGLDITVLGGQSGDPGNDNWVLKGFLPSNLVQANAPWLQVTIHDSYAGVASLGGPRYFSDISHNGVESMFQGGVRSNSAANYYLNHNIYDANNGGWANDPNNWYTGPGRSAGEHTVFFGMKTDGSVDMRFDGVLGMSIAANPNCTDLIRNWLGVSTAPDTTFTATYDDLEWGTNYGEPGYTGPNAVPEPSTLAMLFPAALFLLCNAWPRRRS